MKFLIQTIDGKIKHDFSFTLIEAIGYHNWYGQDSSFQYVLSDNELLPNYIPIGSVEFVSNYLKTYFDYTPKPKNIPDKLLDKLYTKRRVFNGTEKDIHELKFVKSNDSIKHFTEECDSAPVGNYQISDIIDIESEWRCFVYKNKLVGLQNYSGDFCMFPDVRLINKMIVEYSTAPIAYTLDVGINTHDGTFIIEAHDFFSCGLYGFSDLKILPFMFYSWWRETTNNLVTVKELLTLHTIYSIIRV